jgi:hypothetical protein
MSRTDVHRPWTVQLQDPYNRHLLYRYPAWPWETGLAPVKNFGCGCRLCTDHFGRKATRRAQRHQAQRDLRALLAQAAAGELDEDGPLPRRAEAW